MESNQAIYKKLQNAAINQKSVTYSSLASLAGLDMEQQRDRTKLGEILGSISTKEHQEGRPLLSVVAWFSGRAEPSKGFYNLAESLGLYSNKQNKDEFFIEELNKVYGYWGAKQEFRVSISVEDYKKALLSDEVLKERSIELLSTLYNAQNCEATSTELANSLGYPDFPPVNALIGKLGKRITKFLNIDNPIQKEWWRAIAEGEDKENGFTWRLKSKLFDALVELNLLQEIETTIFPDTLLPKEEYLEGSKRSITVNSYERNNVARNKCITHYGPQCIICNFDFSKVYGAIGEGFIHVHHLVELATINGEYKVDPIKDLRPVCPNCHAMLHRQKPAYSIEELVKIIG